MMTSRIDKAMTPEQFTQVVEAILNGKYSWACLLILQFAGYNPLHYIPYRTYNRLMKENVPSRKAKHSDGCEAHAKSMPQTCLDQLEDLHHIETLKQTHAEVHGGFSSIYVWLFNEQNYCQSDSFFN
jgi:hypothetical protein